MKYICLILALCCYALSAQAQIVLPTSQPTTQPVTRFEAVDLYIDSHGQMLGAYQIEMVDPSETAKLVGVEGGETAAYQSAPFYDPKALQQSRVIIAAFSTEKTLPIGKTRVARLHFQITGPSKPDYSIKLMVAGGQTANRIDATATWMRYQAVNKADKTAPATTSESQTPVAEK